MMERSAKNPPNPFRFSKMEKMIPATSGIQASAAATVGGRSSDEGSLVGPPAGIGGGEEGWPGSVGSGMYYIHRIKGTFVNSECVVASFDFSFVADLKSVRYMYNDWRKKLPVA